MARKDSRGRTLGTGERPGGRGRCVYRGSGAGTGAGDAGENAG